MLGVHFIKNIPKYKYICTGIITIDPHIHAIRITAMMKIIVPDDISSVTGISANIPGGGIVRI
jgi:hypothetical protein